MQAIVLFLFVVGLQQQVFTLNDSTANSCVDGRNAPARAQFRWSPNAKISIRFRKDDFRPEEIHALQTPVREWQKILGQSATGISIHIDDPVFDSEAPEGVLLIKRGRLSAAGRLGEIYATHVKDGYITAANVSFEPSITNTSILRRLLAHEIGHAFGLADCPSCANNTSIMNIFRQVKISGLSLGSLFIKVAESPSRCDVSAMSNGYETLKPSPDQMLADPSMATLENHNDQRGTIAEDLSIEKLEAAQLDTTAPETGAGKTLLESVESIRSVSLSTSDPRLLDLARQEASSIKALQQFAFKRDVLIETLNAEGKVTGEYHRISQMVLDDSGQRIEKIISFPKPTLKRLIISREDVEDIAGTQMLGLDVTRMDSYLVSDAGHDFIGGKDYLLFRITPADLNSAKLNHVRVFDGVAWIDSETMKIVKLRGRTLPEGNQRFPLFETLRGPVDKTNLFPVSTFADDILRFPGLNVRMRMSVRYSEFRKFTSEVKIIEDVADIP